MASSDCIALVTGGSRGIGYGIARALLADGARVMITGREASRVAAAVKTLGTDAPGASSRIAGDAVDVRDRVAVERIVAATAERFGGLNTLINNAGVGAFVEVAAMAPEQWSAVIDTNLTGVFHCTRAAMPLLKRAGGGWIISIASLAGRNYFPGGAAYCASKAGLVAFSESLMQEVRADGIRVSVIMPGSVKTDFSGPSVHADDSWKLTPDDVAQVVIDLLRHPARSLPSKVEIRPARTKAV
jgi:NAD(P)-dependent dehydrogenase (short-subunit alcohol dehydrogenase family)